MAVLSSTSIWDFDSLIKRYRYLITIITNMTSIHLSDTYIVIIASYKYNII